MRLELDQNSSPIPFAEAPGFENDLANPAAEAASYLREGIKAAQAGNRAGARTSLMRAAELHPANETVWLWLASISEYPEELFVFLTKVLEINPANPRALEWASATRSLLAKNFVQRGIDAAEASLFDAAAQYFNQALEYDEQNPMAWLWLASLADSNEGKLSYLEKVLEFDPENQSAGAAYKAARDSIRSNLLAEARTAAVAGNHSEAFELLDAILAEEPNAEDAWILKSHLANGFDEKIAAFTRILEINPDNATAKASLESLNAIVSAVAPTPAAVDRVEIAPSVETSASDGASDESLEEEPAALIGAEPSENTYAALPPAETEEPVWMMSKAEETASDEPAYDGSIQINYGEAADTEAEFASHEYINTDAENEFEPVAEMPISFGDPTGEASHPTEEDSVSDEYPSETAVADDPEEIVYDLAPNPESEAVGALAGPDDAHLNTENTHAEESGFSEPVPSPFTPFENTSTTDEYSTIASFNLDPDILANLQNLDSIDSPPTTEAPYAGENADMDFGMTMIGGRVPEPEPDGGVDMPFGMTMMGSRVSLPEAADRLSVPFDLAEFGANIPMPDANFDAPVQQSLTGFETCVAAPDLPAEPARTKAPCSYCSFENDSQAISCQGCMSVLTLADLEMLLGNQHADKSVLRRAVERMESERASRSLDEAELTTLGIGHLNLRNLQYGYAALLEASQANPNNVVLASQVNALLIRLEEIKLQDEAHGSMVKGKTILVVDDSATVRKLIAGKLEKCGHDVFCSSDGVEAMERLEDLRPDLILLDIAMPRMDGYQVCKLIRSNPSTKDVPVVMISGKDGFFDKVRGRMAGTSGYITKPFGPETLMKAVESHLMGEVEA